MRGPWVASEHYYASNIFWPANINKYWREALRNASPWETLTGWPDTSARSLEDLSPASFSRQFSYARAKERLCRRANTSVAMYYMGYQFCNCSVKADKRVSQWTTFVYQRPNFSHAIELPFLSLMHLWSFGMKSHSINYCQLLALQDYKNNQF